MAVDDFQNSHNRTDPVTLAVVCDLSSTDATLDDVSRALFVGTAGDLKVTMAGGGDVTFTNITAGWHPLRVTKVFKTGTTADDIVACW